jgi:acyl carrier protein
LEIYDRVNAILCELLDLDGNAFGPESYLVRDLGLESIDFLELAVALNDRFQVSVHDDTLFLRNLRLHLAEAAEAGLTPVGYLGGRYDFLSQERLQEIVADLDGGPVLKVKDVVSYIRRQIRTAKAA